MPDDGGGYTAGEKIAGILLGLLALGLLFIAADMATGGRLTGAGKPCGCPEEDTPDDSG